MTIQIVHDEVNRFLASEEPEVLCITGKWGVGKTYTWRTYLEASCAAKQVKLQNYAYVSLFGVGSLDALKQAVIENTLTLKELSVGPDLDAVKGLVDRAKQWRKGLPLLQLVPHVDKAFGVLSPFLFLGVRKQIICIDDLERRGRNLDLKDVLGLVSLLREQRDCKIVLLLNDEKLEGEARADFQAQLEKVIDTRITFAPTPEEAAQIGLNENNPFYEKLKAHCIALGITNIRVIKKIERACVRLEELLQQHDQAVRDQGVHSAALFGWSHFEPETQTAPSIDYILAYSQMGYLMDAKKEKDEQKKAWASLLANYGFNNADEFDVAISAGISQGYFDPAEIRKCADDLNKKVIFSKNDSSFSKAWDLYHYSWASVDDVLDQMSSAFKVAVETITPMNLSGTISFFRELGRPEEAKELLDFYMANRNEPRKFYDLNASPFGGEVKDPAVRAAFADKLSAFAGEVDLKSILIRIGTSSGWSNDDVSVLAGMPASAYRALFEATEGTDLHRMIKAALQFGEFGNATDQMKLIAERASEALREIGKTSTINARRVRMYGVEIDAGGAEKQA